MVGLKTLYWDQYVTSQAGEKTIPKGCNTKDAKVGLFLCSFAFSKSKT
jgi:hypothetical protein